MTDESKQNPTETAPPEPPWIRDQEAGGAGLMFDFAEGVKSVAALCAGEVIHCEFCGRPFPLWPIAELATHFFEIHKNDLTVGAQTNWKLLALPVTSQATLAFIQGQLLVRVALRRRAWQLGFAKMHETATGQPRGPLIVPLHGGKVM